MSRLASRVGPPMPVTADLPGSPSDDRCPVCGTTRYLQKDMFFLIADCYHKICNGCVERRFSSGPALCPVAGCKRTLRRGKFHKPTFADLQMEAEVDIRKRLNGIFNRREDEFENIRAYNNYLNDVEDITFNLINKIDLKETEAKIKVYQEEHGQEILENIKLETIYTQDEAAKQAAEQEAARLRRQANLRAEDEERRELEAARREIVDKLASGDGDAIAIARHGEQAILKKARQRQTIFDRPEDAQADRLAIRGLKKKRQHEPEAPFDPFAGMTEDREYYVLQDDYQWDWLKDAKTEANFVAGGYDIKEFYARALCEAFSGLGVFVGEEKIGDETSSAEVATMAAVDAGAVDVKMTDDVF